MFGFQHSTFVQCTAAAAIAAFVAYPATAQTAVPMPAPPPAVKPQDILRFMWEDNAAGMQLALNAEKITHTPAVLAYARLVVIDSKAILNTLSPAMKERQISVAPQMVKQAETHMASRNGIDFNRSFLSAQIAHLQSDMGRYQADETSSDKAVARVAAMALPLVQQHLDLAAAVRSSLGGGITNGTTTTP